MVPGALPQGVGPAVPACEGDWLTSIMDQALSVGLWGGSSSPQLLDQGKGQPTGASAHPNAIQGKGLLGRKLPKASHP